MIKNYFETGQKISDIFPYYLFFTGQVFPPGLQRLLTNRI